MRWAIVAVLAVALTGCGDEAGEPPAYGCNVGGNCAGPGAWCVVFNVANEPWCVPACAEAGACSRGEGLTDGLCAEVRGPNAQVVGGVCVVARDDATPRECYLSRSESPWVWVCQ